MSDGELPAIVVAALSSPLVVGVFAVLARMPALLRSSERQRRALTRDLALLEHAPEGGSGRARLAARLDAQLGAYVDELERPSRWRHRVSAIFAVLLSLMSGGTLVLFAILLWAVAWAPDRPESSAVSVTAVVATAVSVAFVVAMAADTWRDARRYAVEARDAERDVLARRYGVGGWSRKP